MLKCCVVLLMQFESSFLVFLLRECLIWDDPGGHAVKAAGLKLLDGWDRVFESR
jgi:hypothetical protein